MSDQENKRNETLLSQTVEIVSSYVSNNSLAVSDLPRLIEETYAALNTRRTSIDAADPERPTPAVPIKASVQPDFIVCLEDGKELKMLKRHLKTAYGMTPDEYRTRWNLPFDYPMVAPNYAKQRSRLAKQIGLGTGGRNAKK
ncbi:MAG: MucR family transcriptional regulator [Rhodospirillaceae bacterium]|nr:MucR family transcriptional regulator [Rhodospirillaceae bacterium]MCY4238182.1 MucR family transcriptional regulator [Rhodospirillaceae bacterium]MCY4310244.1 MucR family transcriptional regulator [Rhodospirillaceae bacterium]